MVVHRSIVGLNSEGAIVEAPRGGIAGGWKGGSCFDPARGEVLAEVIFAESWVLIVATSYCFTLSMESSKCGGGAPSPIQKTGKILWFQVPKQAG
jgi:hypothetical protein